MKMKKFAVLVEWRTTGAAQWHIDYTKQEAETYSKRLGLRYGHFATVRVVAFPP